MILVFTGFTASGKTTAETDLLKHYDKVKKIITYTTRPKRKDEQNGVDYNFITEQEFQELESNNKIIIPRKFSVYENGESKVWSYGMKMDMLILANDYTTILDPKGVRELISIIGRENIKIIYFWAKDEDLAYRAALRGDEPKEFARRLESDKEEFKDLVAAADLVLYTGDDSNLEENRMAIIKLLEDSKQDVYIDNDINKG